MTLPTRIGPCEILDQIGAGGMGTVYEARHQDTGARVALKTIRQDALTGAHGMRALRREVEVLATLRHPNVVQIVDFDLQANTPWFAMEFIEGRPFSGWQRQATDTISTADTFLESAGRTDITNPDELARFREAHGLAQGAEPTPYEDYPAPEDWYPEPELRTKLSWLGQVARALEFLHGNMLVHADIKPDNILIREDGVPVLVDFGLVARMERRLTRQTLDRMQTRAQTMEYAAPERLTGTEFDARADLYALGCMFYEVFTGDPPFTGAPSAVAIAHLVTPPDKLDDLDDPPPAGIQHLVTRLLQKEPGARAAYAREVIAVLEDHGIATEPAGMPLPATRSYLYQPPMIGFDEEVDQIQSYVQRVREPHSPCLVRVEGPAGSGKSRFALAVMNIASGQGWGIHIAGPRNEVGAQFPFEAFGSTIRGLVTLAAAGEWKPRPGAFWLAWLEPRLAEYLADEDRRMLEQVDDFDAGQSIDATARELANAIRETSAKTPILVIAESFEHLDDGSLKLITEIGRLSKEQPWLIAATSRRGASDEAHIEMPRLGAGQVRTIVEEVFGQRSLDQELVDNIHELADGRPGKVLELLYSLLDQGWIRQDRYGRWHAELAGTIEGALDRVTRDRATLGLEARVARLDGPVRRLGQRAAVLGTRFDLAKLSKLTGTPLGEVLLGVSELIRLNLVTDRNFAPTMAATNTLEFSTKAIRDSFYRTLSRDEQKELHQRAAATANAIERARHLEAAGDDLAHGAWLEAAEYARERFANDARITSLEGALRTGDLDDEAREELLYQRFRVIFDTSSTEKIRAEAAALMSELNLSTARALTLRDLCKLSFMEGDVVDVETWRGALEDLAHSTNDRVSAVAGVGLAFLALTESRSEDALKRAKSAVEAAHRLGDRVLEYDAWTMVGESEFYTGDFDKCVEGFRRAFEIAKEIGGAKLAQSRANLAAVEMKTGYVARGRRATLEVTEYQQKAGFLWPELISRWNLGMASIEMGDFALALEAKERFMELRSRLCLSDDLSPYLRYEARVRAFLGAFDSAIRLVDQAIDVAQSDVETASGLSTKAMVLMHSGDLEGASKSLEHDFDSLGTGKQISRLVLTTARVALARADLESAQLVLDQVPDWMLSQNHYMASSHRLELGRLRIAQGRVDEGIEYLESAKNWFRKYECPYRESHALLALASVAPDAADLERIQRYVDSQPFEARALIVRQLAELWP